MVTETKNHLGNDLNKSKGKRSHKKIPEFKPKYELYLSAYANIQSLQLCNEYLIALDNDNTCSILKSRIIKPTPLPVAPNTVRRAFGLGQGQQIPNKLLMRQDEDTDNEPMNTEMDDCQEAQR